MTKEDPELDGWWSKQIEEGAPTHAAARPHSPTSTRSHPPTPAPDALQLNAELHKDERSGFSYKVPNGAEVEVFRSAIEALPVQVRW
jgi:hypothetical protein